ncbi:MAG: hypothetical protein ACLT9P_00060 [Evtepia gabavorous]
MTRCTGSSSPQSKKRPWWMPFWPPVRPLTSGARSPAKPFCSRRWPRTVILCVALAPPGPFQATVAAFSALFGISSPAQTQVIQDRAQVIQTSDTDNGVTVSMESVAGDALQRADPAAPSGGRTDSPCSPSGRT